jgi:hypothetical protein
MGLVVKIDTQRDEIFFDKTNYIAFRIRNCIHLLAANSVRVEEIEQDWFVLFLPHTQGIVHFSTPFDFCCHGYFSLCG